MWSLLLNHRVWVAVVLVAVVGWVCFHIDALEDELVAKDGIIAGLKADVETWKAAASSRQIALDGCAKNLEDIRAANEEALRIARETQDHRRKWRAASAAEAQRPEPKAGEPCISGGRIDENHRQVLAAAIADFNRSVRRKINRAAGDRSGAGAREVLPAPGTAGH